MSRTFGTGVLGTTGPSSCDDDPMSVTATRSRATSAAFLISLVLVGAVTAAVLVLDVLAAGAQVPADAFLDPGWLTAVTALAQLIPGMLLLWQLPRHPVAWVLVGSGVLWLLDALAASWAIYALYVRPGTGARPPRTGTTPGSAPCCCSDFRCYC